MARWSIVLGSLILGGMAGNFVAGPYLLGQNAAPSAVSKEMTSYRDIVKKVLPAVVSIEGQVKPKPKPDSQTPKRRPRIDDPSVPEEFRKFFDEFGGQLDIDEVPVAGFGSGFLIDGKGTILTNYHVVAGVDQVKVQLRDGRKFTSKDIHGDQKTDLAIIRLDAKEKLPYLELGDSDVMEIGDRVLAVGAPFGLTGSVTAGIVSAKGRNGLNVNMYEDFIQTDAAINPGNSGGPLINLEGKVIGINSAIKSRSGGFQGVGLAIASNLAKNIMQDLLKDGVVRRGYLGVQMTDLDPEVAARLGIPNHTGVVVGSVVDGTPAEKAGLQSGDIITGVEGKPIKDGRELQKAVAGSPIHKPLKLQVVHDGNPKTISVTLEEQPKDFRNARISRPRVPREDPENITLGKVGVSLRDLDPELAQQMGYNAKVSGAVITKVVPNSPAAEAGLARGMVISKIDKHPVKSAQDAQQLADKGSLEKGLLLQVQTALGGTTFVIVKSDT
ncbi:MAG TPA: Do family serine endopeptidase [Gemmataceae bacterium]|nr:Do family serine endopeptidase [Gemmataceae bacterium]